jgi:hypothetical protein
MNAEKIIENKEVVEATEEIATGFGKGFKVAVGIGLAVLGGGIAYKYVIKPIVAKIKTRRTPVAHPTDGVPVADIGEEFDESN